MLAIVVVTVIEKTNIVNNVVDSVQLSEGTVIIEVNSDNLMSSLINCMKMENWLKHGLWEHYQKWQ